MLCRFLQTHQKKGGRSLKQAHCKRNLIPSRKQVAYKLSRSQSSISSLKRVSGPLFRQDSSCSNRQHHICVLHKQGRSHEVGPTLCPAMEDLDLVYQKTSDSQSPTYSRPAEHGSRQAIQARPDHPNRVPQIDLFATRFNNKLLLFVSPVPDPLATAVDALHGRILTHMPSHQWPYWAN